MTRKYNPSDQISVVDISSHSNTKATSLRQANSPWIKSYYIPSQILPPYGPLTRCVKLQVAHAPGMPGTFSPAADFKGNRKLAIPACITARAWRTCRDACRDRLPAVTGKTFPAFPAHAHPQFCVSGKRPMARNTYMYKRLRKRRVLCVRTCVVNCGRGNNWGI